MNYKEKMLDFLTQPENICFLVELEIWIPEAKQRWLDKCMEVFIGSIPNGWEGYRFVRRNADWVLQKADLPYENHYHLAFHGGTLDSNTYFGIIGPGKISGMELQEFKFLREAAAEMKMTKQWQHYLFYGFFTQPRKDLFCQTEPFDVFQGSQGWYEEFWSFATFVRSKLEKLNNAVDSIDMCQE